MNGVGRRAPFLTIRTIPDFSAIRMRVSGAGKKAKEVGLSNPPATTL
jgi:hypothetical protein